jgi:hypothetical protein
MPGFIDITRLNFVGVFPYTVLERLDQIDVLIVTRLDRFVRATRDSLNRPNPFEANMGAA